MPDNRKEDRRSPSISIGGSVSGPVTVGDGNVVVGSVSQGASAVLSGGQVSQVFNPQQRAVLNQVGTEAQIEELAVSIQKLKHAIEQDASKDLIPDAKAQAERLVSEVTSEKPDLSALHKVKAWFVDNLPSLLGTITGILTHPIVGKLVEASGEYTIKQFRQRLGLPDTT